MKTIAILKPNGELTGMGTTSDAMLTVLQTECGGYVQAVDLTGTLTMWCNEEGKLNGSEWNECATAIWHAIYGATDTIFGTVVFTGGADGAAPPELLPGRNANMRKSVMAKPVCSSGARDKSGRLVIVI